MRTTEERMRLIYRRTQELKREKQRKRQRYAAALCFAASFCLIAGLGFWVSSHIGRAAVETAHASDAASLLASNGALGYILMGIMSFLLGVCVTILLFYVSRRQKRRGKPEDPDDEL